MKKNIAILSVLILMSLTSYSQEKISKFDARLGMGVSLLGTGDMTTLYYENELNYRINSYFTGAFSFAMGRSNYGVFETSSFSQGNLNLFCSPFKNTNRNDFRVGVGITNYGVSDIYRSSATWVNNQLVLEEFTFEKRKSFGFNILIENTYAIKPRFLIGLKVFTQPYFNGDINSGILLKLGYRL